MTIFISHFKILGVLILAAVFDNQGFALRLPSLARRGVVQRPYTAFESGSSPADPGPALLSSREVEPVDRPIQADTQRKDFADGDDTTIRNHWALLIAGSSGWSNYRHQADVCHAYQVLLRGGLRPNHIVVMIYDDIAADPENPFPGQVFNSPGGPDVYAGVRVDYSGPNVNAATFLAVLEGNASALPPGSGSGRVIASGPYDRVFVFYSDHGSPGVLGMPTGSFLYADQLVEALARKHQRRGYKEAVLYVEACESGSMFEGLLPSNISAYVTTASNAFESSWGTYCPGMYADPSPPLSTCLGDLYSVAWMENAESCDLTQETLLAQYDIVRNRTSHNFTYWMGSHVMQYGTLDIDREVAGDYQGMRNRGDEQGDAEGPLCRPQPGAPPASGSAATTSTSSSASLSGSPVRPYGTGSRGQGGGGGGGGRSVEDGGFWRTVRVLASWLLGGRRWEAVAAEAENEQAAAKVAAAKATWLPYHPQRHTLEQREADLAPLRHRAVYGSTPEARQQAQAALDREVSRRRGLDSAALTAASHLLATQPNLLRAVAAASATALSASTALNTASDTSAAAPTASAGDSSSGASAIDAAFLGMLAQQLVRGPMGRPAPGLPLVDDWDCLRSMVAAWEGACGPLDQYGIRHTRMMANLCNAGVAPGDLGRALRSAGGGEGGCGGGGEEGVPEEGQGAGDEGGGGPGSGLLPAAT